MSKVGNRIKERGPVLMTAFGILGFAYAVYNAVKAKERIDEDIERKRKELEVEELPAKEVVKIVAKDGWPTVVAFGAACACTIGGQAMAIKRSTAIAGACVLYENAYRDLHDATKEVMGDKKMSQVDNKIAENKVKQYQLCEENVFYTGLGNTLCMEALTGRYFRTNVNQIDIVESELNDLFRDNGLVSVSDYFELLRLPYTPIGDMGWDKNSSELLTRRFELEREAVKTESGEPCLVIMPCVLPDWNYCDLH